MAFLELIATSSPGKVLVSFRGLRGNRPADFGNCIALWRLGMNPYEDKPLLQLPLLSIEPEGEDSFVLPTKNEGESFLAGYASGGVLSSLCATAEAAPNSHTDFNATARIRAVEQDATSVMAYWESPSGNNARAGAQWVGMWAGKDHRWDGKELVARQWLDDASNQGHVTLTGRDIEPGKKYTLVYATGPNWTNLAATHTFAAV